MKDFEKGHLFKYVYKGHDKHFLLRVFFGYGFGLRILGTVFTATVNCTKKLNVKKTDQKTAGRRTRWTDDENCYRDLL